jgi:ribonuclease D
MEIITATNELEKFCTEAADFDFVTIDTEFLRETTYWPKLCLIQAATNDRAVIIDPLTNGIDLAPFFSLLSDKNIVKVFHAARQDIEIFVKLTGNVPLSIFDTQVAASVCGFGDSISYDNLVRTIVGEQIDKSSRFTDWSQRPLTNKQLTYALADVTHLRDIYIHLIEKISQKSRHSWVEDENQILTSIDTYVIQPENAWKRMKMKVNRPRDFAALKLLSKWREQRAQDRNQPRGRILKDDAILELSVQRPTRPEKFDRLRAVPKGFGRSSSASEVIGLLKQVEDLPNDELPKMPKRNHGPSPKGPIGDLIRVLLKAISEREGVASRILATSSEIDAIVLDDEANVPALKGWRREIFGQKALDIKHGKLGLAATKEAIIEVEVNQPK